MLNLIVAVSSTTTCLFCANPVSKEIVTVVESDATTTNYLNLGYYYRAQKQRPFRRQECPLKLNTHRRRRRDETVLSRRVGVGGVYMN